jgi:hypothetical protein
LAWYIAAASSCTIACAVLRSITHHDQVTVAQATATDPGQDDNGEADDDGDPKIGFPEAGHQTTAGVVQSFHVPMLTNYVTMNFPQSHSDCVLKSWL